MSHDTGLILEYHGHAVSYEWQFAQARLKIEAARGSTPGSVHKLCAGSTGGLPVEGRIS
jgi:hypothetical protein